MTDANLASLKTSAILLITGTMFVILMGGPSASAQTRNCPMAGNWSGTGACQDSSAYAEAPVINKSRIEARNVVLYVAIKRADEVVNRELASERAKQTNLASQFQTNLKRAMAGDAESQYLVAKAYENGLGVEKNEAAAFEWSNKSASRGNAHGENYVGWDYLYGGDGITKDYATALDLPPISHPLITGVSLGLTRPA